MKLSPKPLLTLASAALLASAGLNAYAQADDEQASGAVKANIRPNECGLQEQAGPAASFGPFDGSIHFFQPGEMAPNPNTSMEMLSYADSQMHLELDLKANEYGTNWGYAVDETPAGLPIMYQLSNAAGKVVASGMMTAMNAIDGSHYGTNLPKGSITEPGKYMMKITVYPPKDYDLHKDYITGVPADGWFAPLSAEMPWEITQENLDIVKQNTVADPMAVPERCKAYPVKKFEDPAAEQAMKAALTLKPLPMMKGM